MFLSGRNFQYGDPELMDWVTIYKNKEKNITAKTTDNDLSWIFSEINSGATISV